MKNHPLSSVVRIQKARTTLLLDHPFFGTLLFRLGAQAENVAKLAGELPAGVTRSQEAFLRILRTPRSCRTLPTNCCANSTSPSSSTTFFAFCGELGRRVFAGTRSARMVAAAPDMSRLLDRMEKSGLITRERAEDDRRQVSTFITDSGKKLLTIIEGPVHEQTHRLFEV
jgi:hypothetical protein